METPPKPYLNAACWADDALPEAVALVEALSEAEWASLSGIWTERPPVWQMALIDALRQACNARAVRLTLRMLDSDELHAAIEAAIILSGKLDFWRPNAALRPHLLRLQTLARENEQPALQRLLDAML